MLPLRRLVDLSRGDAELLRLQGGVERDRQHATQLVEQRPFLVAVRVVREDANRVAILALRVHHRMERDHVHEVIAILAVVGAAYRRRLR